MSNQQESGRVVIAGGSGFLGVSLAEYLGRCGWNVTLLSRKAPKSNGPWKHIVWDARTLGDWTHELNGTEAIINLVGRSVDCVKTPDHRDEILRSRVEATRVLGLAVRKIESPPPVWIQMSTAHIYGDPPEVVCTEDSPFGYGLAPFVAEAWEKEFHASVLPTQRWVMIRTSFVIGRDRGVGNGALGRLVPLVRFGLGGTVGSGTQGMSWIHETDLNRIFHRALTDRTMQGTYIGSSPNPVSNREFMREMRRTLKVPFGLPAPAWMIRAGSVFLKTDPELALYGRYVISKRLQDENFQFQFPNLQDALKDITNPRPIEQSVRCGDNHQSC